MICCEINKPQSRPILISAWCRPPCNSEMKIFDSCEIFLKKCDVESKKLLIIGDINCNILKSPRDSNTNKLMFLTVLYNLEQLIKE